MIAGDRLPPSGPGAALRVVDVDVAAVVGDEHATELINPDGVVAAAALLGERLGVGPVLAVDERTGVHVEQVPADLREVGRVRRGERP